jgi:hypothetical protein
VKKIKEFQEKILQQPKAAGTKENLPAAGGF